MVNCSDSFSGNLLAGGYILVANYLSLWSLNSYVEGPLYEVYKNKNAHWSAGIGNWGRHPFFYFNGL